MFAYVWRSQNLQDLKVVWGVQGLEFDDVFIHNFFRDSKVL